MTRLYVVCEGPTEETFINEVLEPVLRPSGLWPKACLIGPPGHKGGWINRQRVEKHVLRLLKGDLSSFCTTLFDYYGLAADFPGMPIPQNTPTARKAETIQIALYEVIASQLDERVRPDRFIPYIQMHEFEGLLFSDPARFAKGLYNEELQAPIQAIRDKFVTPEDINDGQATAPSKRVIDLYGKKYNKILHGSLAALEIGIEAIRKECPLFDGWVAKLSKLDPAQPNIAQE